MLALLLIFFFKMILYIVRLLLNEVWKEYEIQRAEEDYILEKEFAGRELEEKKVELQDNLISEYEEKKRNVESERITIELTGDSMEVTFYSQVAPNSIHCF